METQTVISPLAAALLGVIAACLLYKIMRMRVIIKKYKQDNAELWPFKIKYQRYASEKDSVKSISGFEDFHELALSYQWVIFYFGRWLDYIEGPEHRNLAAVGIKRDLRVIGSVLRISARNQPFKDDGKTTICRLKETHINFWEQYPDIMHKIENLTNKEVFMLACDMLEENIHLQPVYMDKAKKL